MGDETAPPPRRTRPVCRSCQTDSPADRLPHPRPELRRQPDPSRVGGRSPAPRRRPPWPPPQTAAPPSAARAATTWSSGAPGPRRPGASAGGGRRRPSNRTSLTSPSWFVFPRLTVTRTPFTVGRVGDGRGAAAGGEDPGGAFPARARLMGEAGPEARRGYHKSRRSPAPGPGRGARRGRRRGPGRRAGGLASQASSRCGARNAASVACSTVGGLSSPAPVGRLFWKARWRGPSPTE